VAKAVGNIASKEVQDKLGPLAPLATCATQQNANLGKCAADFASANLPKIPGASDGTNAAAKAIVACVGAADFAACAKDPAIAGAQNIATQALDPEAQKAIEAAMKTIEKLKPDAPITMDAGVSSEKDHVATLQNIVMVADGIKNKKWDKVLFGAGPELTIVAGDIILSIFLTPAVAGALGPAVAAMIHNDAAAAQLALQAIANGDPVALGQVLFTWYETQFIDKPCALLGDNDVKNTVCGGLSDAIKFISDTGGDLAKKLLGAGKDILEWLGVWGTVDSIATDVWNKLKHTVEDIGHFFGIGDGSSNENKWKPAPDCPQFTATFTPKDYTTGYFANNYLTCLPAATQRPQAAVNASIPSMNGACETALNRCINNVSGVRSTCAAMGDSLSDLANQVNAGMGTAADMYTSTMGPAAYVSDQFKKAKEGGLAFGADPKHGLPDFCSADFWNAAMQNGYVNECAGFVNKQFPGMKPNASACTAIQTQAYNNRAESACRFSLSANLEGSHAAGKDLVGPDSTYCKAQQKLIEDNPCKLTGKTVVVPGSGQTFLDPTGIDCRRQKLPFETGPGGLAIIPQLTLPRGGDTRQSFPNAMHPDQLFPPSGGGHGGIGLNGGDRMTPPPVVGGLPNGGQGEGQAKSGDCKDPRGCGGFNMVNGNTNEGAQNIPRLVGPDLGNFGGFAVPRNIHVPDQVGLPQDGQAKGGDCNDPRGCGGFNLSHGNANDGAQQKSGPKAKDEATQSRSGDCTDPRGCGGIGLINGNTNESAQKKATKDSENAQRKGKSKATDEATQRKGKSKKAKDDAAQRKRKSKATDEAAQRKGPPSPNGGASGSKSAMDILQGEMSNNAINSVSASSNFGGVAGQRGGPSRRNPSGYGHRPTASRNHGSPGGSGGFNTSQPGSSGGSGGFSTTKPIPRSPSTAPAASGPDGLIDYGGCSSCNQRNDNLHVH
jgi:hypothetical protein